MKFVIEIKHLDGIWHKPGKLATYANGVWTFPKFDTRADALAKVMEVYPVELEEGVARIRPVPPEIASVTYVGLTSRFTRAKGHTVDVSFVDGPIIKQYVEAHSIAGILFFNVNGVAYAMKHTEPYAVHPFKKVELD